ncbi:XrtB/PEP-CTERM-associated polysaccharide biosynthesis outer membrane protein EpsL [Caenimonas aquaedulcis]|uniref:Outer membrane beta-barrel protein n=1 Tax=Caenimonas aquaedulcis TaxID=2793270 RepID=A0A931H838_9BURK|nr:XrtB/PEP-CTERM-associated polysaccharide biosynthesis outer membrane protein EpsL [Caenimonas aquaedulcis]MBG9390075.1 outer membrane beta-barrel protein [Caenimonas aquaedulcis]
MNQLSLIALATACAFPALAQDAAPAPKVITFRAGVGVEHDTNVLRQSTGEISDNIGTVSVGAHADKTIGLQRLRGDIEATTYRYQDQTNLNYSTINYSAAWDWSLTPHFHGVLSADRRQAREVSTDPITFGNRIGRRTEKAEVLEGTYDVGARLRALAGVTHTSSESTEPRSWDASPSVRSVRLGVGYETPKGSLLTLRARRGDGDYKDPTPGAAAGSFKENEVELAVKWPVTAKTTVEGRIAHLQREHDIAPQLDFSGMVGGASVSWEVTAKTRFIAGYQHDLVATGLLTGGHVETDRIFFTPVWQFDPKFAATFRYDRSERRWRDVPVASPDQGRSEKVEYAQIGLDWTPRQAITVSTTLRSEKLNSSLPGASYKATVFGVAAKATF